MLIWLLSFNIAMFAAVLDVCQSQSQPCDVGGWIETFPNEVNYKILEPSRKINGEQLHKYRFRNAFTGFTKFFHQLLLVL